MESTLWNLYLYLRYFKYTTGKEVILYEKNLFYIFNLIFHVESVHEHPLKPKI